MIKKKIIKKSNNNWLDSFKDGGPVDPTYWRNNKPMVNDPSMDAISKVLLFRNQDKNFMQRAAGFGYQGSIPTKDIPGQDPESTDNSNLLMGSGDYDVFPSIIQTGPEQLSYQPLQTKEFITTPSWDVADYFATKGYKRAANSMYGMKYKNGGWLNNYDTGGDIEPEDPINPTIPPVSPVSPPVSPISPGYKFTQPANYGAGITNPLIPQTLVTDAAAVKKQVLPTKQQIQQNNIDNAIKNESPDTLREVKGPWVPEKPSAWEQKMLQKEEEAKTRGLSRVTFNQFGEPVLEWGGVGEPGFYPPASGRIDADYTDPLTLAVTFGAGAYGKGLSLADAALVGLDAGTYSTSSLGKSMGKWGTELVKGSITAGKLKMPEFVTALRTEAAGFNPATVTPHPSLNPTQQTYTGKWIQTASPKNPGAFDEMLAYVSGPERKQTGDMQLLSSVMPWSQAQKLVGKNLPFDGKTMSFGPGIHGTLENALKQKAINNQEYVLLKNYNTRAEKIKQSTNLSGALDKTISRLRIHPDLFNPNEMLSTGLASSMRASPTAVGSSDIIAAGIQNLKNSALTGHITTELQQGSKEMVKHTTGHSVFKENEQKPKKTKIKRIGYKNGGKLNNYADGGVVGDPTKPPVKPPLQEITYHHDSLGGMDVDIQRTVSPYSNKRDIRKYTPIPTSGKDIDFNNNYVNYKKYFKPGGLPPDYNPSVVPYEGNKHWNSEMFMLKPHITNDYKDLHTQDSTIKQNKNNILADMYKYQMLNNPEQSQRKSFRNAKQYLRQNINPKLNGPFLKSYLKDEIQSIGNSMNDMVYYGDTNQINNLNDAYRTVDDFEYYPSLKEHNTYLSSHIGNLNERKVKRISKDYFKNFENLSGKQSRDKWKSWKDESAVYEEKFKTPEYLEYMFQTNPNNKAKPVNTFKNGGWLNNYK